MDIDDDLVHALQEDGRVSVQDLSRRLGVSRATVATRLQTMFDSGAVRVVAAVDPGFLGQHVLAHLMISAAGPARPIAAALAAYEQAVLVSAVGGAPDLIAEVRSGSRAELHDLVRAIRAIPTVTAVETHVYSSVIKGLLVSGHQGETTIDDIDVALIEQLQRDGRTSFRALGDAVRLSPSSVAVRVRRLIDNRVIRISTVETRTVTQRQLPLGIGIVLRGDDDTVVEYLTQRRGVDFAARVIGRFDVLATLLERSSEALLQIMEDLRAMAGVGHVEAWVHLSVQKEDYSRTITEPALRTIRALRNPTNSPYA
ncbi:Lrp/AsnC family transcriptional regulator [Tsukamurella asaccharolytica]|uniref:Lrp/AsnC family transcriptional regulator n=1 Tax=Tsukamurella asaccharolytica TaxID=2592067 RepID=A0A5C5RD12_9ACTN|nr:Lrp/AsnC family transcriptional regulator [Tsukamurella asaccharolytica]TWS20746.1 Lrp/AsnC family transcriptional regulator [Tsukamurella asaccharolytica]